MLSETQPNPPFVGVWPPGDQPLIVVELSREEFPSLRPGFARWDDDDAFVFDRHPSAVLRLHNQLAYLSFDDHTFEPAKVPLWWYAAGTAVLVVIPLPSGVTAGGTPTDRFLTAIDEHTALLAEVLIQVQAP